MALLREHLTGVALRDVNAAGARIALPRGEVTVITFPEDRKAIESLLNPRHPLLLRIGVEARLTTSALRQCVAHARRAQLGDRTQRSGRTPARRCGTL